jgi:hypothetical protein
MAIKIPPVVGRIQDSIDTPFDNSTNGFTADNAQQAIEELANGGGNSASPGFTWGKSGNSNTNTWLLNDTVPSNLTGRRVPINSAKIVEVFVSSQNLDTYNLSIYSHDGDEVNLTLLTTISVSAARGITSTINISIAKDKQLAARITSGSASNVVAGVIIRGSST